MPAPAPFGERRSADLARRTAGGPRLVQRSRIAVRHSPTILAVVILFSTIFTFSDFNIVYILTRGGPVNSTHLFATLAYQVGLNGGNLGQGAAISLFLFPMLGVVVFFQLRYIRKE